MRIRLLVAPSLAASLALAACGGGSGGSGGTPNPPTGPGNPSGPAAPSASAAIAMRTDTDVYGAATSSFAPASVSIVRNGTVTWSNGTDVLHNVTFTPTSGAPSDVGDFATGSQTRVFATAGTFAFRCTNHQGMTGTVTVAP